MKSSAKVTFLALSASSLFMAGCPSNTEDAKASVTIANPAAEYCASKGGRSEMEEDDSGNKRGICHLPDGTAIDEWELFRHNIPYARD